MNKVKEKHSKSNGKVRKVLQIISAIIFIMSIIVLVLHLYKMNKEKFLLNFKTAEM